MNLIGIYIGKYYYFGLIKTFHILIDDPNELIKCKKYTTKINCACILDENIKNEPYINQNVLIKENKPFNIIFKLFSEKEIKKYYDYWIEELYWVDAHMDYAGSEWSEQSES